MTTSPKIVRGQRVKKEKLAVAKQLRRVMTPQERRLWACLRGNRLSGLHFRRQQIIDGFIVDFYCHAAAVVVELDGPVHQGQLDYDAERERWLLTHDLRVLRFTNADVDAGLEAVLTRILEICQASLAMQPIQRGPEANTA